LSHDLNSVTLTRCSTCGCAAHNGHGIDPLWNLAGPN
jgi:hypothetical protein